MLKNLARVLCVTFVLFPAALSAQVSLTTLGTPYTQNFDNPPNAGMPTTGSATWTNNSTIPGWFHARTGTGTTIVANNGGSNTGNLYSYGTGTNADRALGSVGSGNVAVGNLYWGVRLQNNTGSTITTLDVTYTGEQWRDGGATGVNIPQTIVFSYLVGSPTVTGSLAEFGTAGIGVGPLSFTSPINTGAIATLDGNAAANRVTLTSSITGLSIPNGTEVMLRWADPDHGGADHGLSIDNFSVTPQGAAPTPTLNINDVVQAETNAGTTTFAFTVSLTSPAGPGGVTFDIATADGTAQDDNPAVTEDNDYVANSLLAQTILAGSSGPYTFNVTVNGDANNEANETFFVNVTNITGATAGDTQGLGTINNDDGPPTLNINNVSQIEGAAGTTTFAFDVTLTGPAGPGGVTFDIATQDDSATTADNDYVLNSLTGQTIPAGSSGPYTFNVTVNGDTNPEPTETFFVNVTNITGATPGDTQGLGTITTDDAPPDLSVNNVTQAETNAGTTTFAFTVSLSQPAPPGGVTFDIATAPNTATAGTDYVHQALLAQTIPATQSSYTFNVAVNGDNFFEGNETFFVNVTNVTGANVTDGQGLGTINNDDVQPEFSIVEAVLPEGNAGTSIMTFTVTLTGTRESSMDVTVNTNDMSATVADNDYVANTTTLTFAPTDATRTFDVTINGDTNAEGNEQFIAGLSGATGGATISASASQVHGIIRLDDPFSISAVDTPFLENFDVLSQAPLAATTPAAWTQSETGSAANFRYTAGTGSSTTGDTYSFGGAASTERAFGGLQSGALIPTIGAFYRNDTGSTITTLTINYNGEEWRLGTAGRTDRLDFQYSLDATSLLTGTWTDFDNLDFITPDTVGPAGNRNGNAAQFRTAVSGSITGLNIAPNDTFWIRFNDFNASGADDGLAVDDFSIVANISNGLSINDVSILEGDAGTSVLQFTVTRTQPSGSPTTFDIATADGTAQDDNPATEDDDYVANSVVGATIPGDNVTTTYTFNVTINGDVSSEPTENFFVNITNVTNATVLDGQGVGFINADDFTLTLISAIQGNGNQSPVTGTTPTVSGIVTGIKQGGSGGFFVQEEVSDYDSDTNTSEGIFVFTGSAVPAGVVIGNRVAVTGTVQEFPASANPHTVTELGGAISVSVLATGQPLPTAVTLTAADGAPTTNLSQYERYEGMRVAATLEVTAPTGGNTDENDATGSSDGVFYGVISGVSRAFRQPGIPVMDVVPSEAACPACIPRFDRNPERIRVPSTSQPGSGQLNVVVGQTISNLVGPLDYGFFEYSLLPEAASVPIVTGPSTYSAVPAPLATELTVSSFNLQRFYDTTEDPAVDDVVLTSTAFNNRLNKASLAIRDVLETPDVLGVVEMENLTTLQSLATKINTDSAGATNYAAYLEEGNDQGGIDVGFLVNLNRVSVVSVTQFGKDDTFVDPGDSSVDILNDRPPLMLQGTIQRPDATTYAFTVIVNHLRSLNGNEEDSNTGLRVREKRRLQAEFLANFVQNRQTVNPEERIILVGDFNAFQFNDGMVDTINTIKGTPPPVNEVVEPSLDLVNPDLTNLVDLITAGERYSYEFDGNLQVLDHAIVNAPAFSTYTRAAFAHLDAGFPEIFRNDASRPERISDHEGIVAYFDLSPVGQLEFSASNYDVGESTTTFNVTVNRSGGSAGAVSATYTIAAGTATAGSDFTAGTGTVTFANGETSTTFPVTIANDLIDEPNQTIALTLSSPTNGATLGAQSSATITIQDDDAPPVFTISNVSIAEGDSGSSNATLDVTLTGATEFSPTVNWATADDTATTADNDYTTAGATLTFSAAGTQSVTVPIVGDTTDEPNERLFVNLSGATNASIGDAQGEITILDDDGTPTIIINDVSVSEGNSGTSQATLTVTLVGTSSQAITVDWTLDAGTATCCGVDFSGPNGTLTFPVGGPATRTIQATIFGETMFEPDETILVNLSNAAGATISDNQGVITILNDDSVASSSYSATKTVASNGGAFVTGSTVTYTIVLSNNAGFTMADNPSDEFSDVLPSGLMLVSATATSGTAVATVGTNTVTWNGSIASGASVTLSITATITASAGSISNQGFAHVDLDNNGTNESDVPTDDPGSPGFQTTSFGVVTPGDVTATKSVVTTAVPGSSVTYTIVITNNMPHTQGNNPGDEFVDVLPPQLVLVSASATSGTPFANTGTNTVTWNGSIPSGGSVTITINATISPSATGPVSNQGTLNIDLDNNGANEPGLVVTDDPGTGTPDDPTVFVIGAAAGAAIPTLSEWMLIALAMMLAGLAAMKLRM